jgi:nucleoside-diphosphate-sugar epimerase
VTRPRVIVTGARGFVGRHCVPSLVARGFDVHAVTSAERGDSDDAVSWHTADLRDGQVAAELVRTVEPTHLLHLAWETTHGRFWTSPENLRWLTASIDLFRAFADGGGARAVIAGTCAEYRWDDSRCVEGATPLEPRTLYGASKHALHVTAASYAAQTGVALAWGRIFFVYGPGEQSGRLVPSIALRLLRGEPAPASHGRQIRDFLHVADAAEAFVALLASDVTGAVNVASGVPTTIAEVVATIGELTGREDLIRLGALPSLEGEPAELVADVTRLIDEVGLRPRYDLRAGLEDTLEALRTPVTT